MNLSTGYDFISNTLENTSNLSMANYHNFIVAEWDQATLNDTLASMDAAITDYVLSLDLNEHHLYGAARIGVQKREVSRWKREITNGSFTDGLTTYTGTITDPSVETYDVENYKNRKGSKLYQLSNHLGNVLAVISDRLLSKDDNNDNVHDYYVADISSATDYYPFGMEMLGRTYANGAFVDGEYGYGFNGQEEDSEVYGDGNSTTAMYWQYDSRLGRRWNRDPITDPSESPYATNKNNPIKYNDPNGDCPTCVQTELNAGLKLNLVLGKNGGGNLSLFAGASIETGFATTGLNVSGTFYRGGVGTSSSSPTLFTGTFSHSLTLGGGQGTSRPLNTFNSMSGTGVNISYANSISFAQNYTFSSGSTSLDGYSRNQRTSYFGFTALNTVSAGHYNDVKKAIFQGDGKDEFWSAGLNTIINYNGFTASWTSDMYYGKSNHKATYADDEIIGGINYDKQPAFDRSLNNALETFNLTMPGNMFGGTQVTLGMGRTGRSAMWASNRMHNRIKDPEDPTKHFHYLYVPNPTSTVLRLGLQR